MIPKANGYFAFVAAALGVSLTAGRPAVAETMLDQYTVSSMGIAQVNDAGQCVVVVTVDSGAAGANEVRVVGDFSGAAKLYTNFGAADGIVKSAKINASTVILIKRKLKEVSLSDPVSELKRLHKAFVAEASKSLAVKTKLTTAKNVATGLGWPAAAADTAEFKEFAQISTELDSVTEVNNNANTKVTTYSAALTTAGINPVTYLPI